LHAEGSFAMRTWFQRTLALCSLLVAAGAGAEQDRHDWSIELDLGALTAGNSSKLAAAADTDFTRIALVYTGTIKPTLTVNAVVDLVDDGTPGIAMTEAFLSWQPVPRSPFKHQLRVGAFYPPLSLENSGPAWSSPYSISSSAINTWIGEEIRVVGSEWSVRRALGPRASQRSVRLIAAAYYGNDPAGALLSWRGFALHTRQSRLGDALVLPAVPQIQPGMLFGNQAPATEPFIETDHSPGFYYGAEWRLGRRVLLTTLRYDNHADPLTLRNGNYGWGTGFDHIGAKMELPGGFGLILQWLDGTTVMGPAFNGIHVVDNGFKSYFALLTKQHERQRWSLRFDDFTVADYDTTPLDANDESGRALTLAWHYESGSSWSVGVEWQALDVTRPAFTYFARPAAEGENALRVALRYRLRPGRPER
jgi:hypothetical protein